MRRILTFLMGMAVGALLLMGVLKFHLIRAADGLHLIPKVESTLADSYADVRDFGPADWVQHDRIAAALIAAKRTDLMESSVRDSLRDALDGVLSPSN